MFEPLRTFTAPSQLKVEVVLVTPPTPPKLMLGDLRIGDLFIRNRTLCMRVRFCDIEVFSQFRPRTNGIPVINLQTGAVWVVVATEEVERVIDATLAVQLEPCGQ